MVNPEYFIEVAKKGIPKMNPHSNEYRQWWKRESLYCTEGITVGGQFMPPKQYFYLNHGTIELLDHVTQRKKRGRPLLRDVEWDVFKELWAAEQDKQAFMWISGRRGGKSYIASVAAAQEFTFYADNEIVIAAEESKYSDPLMQKVQLHLDGLAGTEFYHNRIKDTPSKELRSGYRVKNPDTGAWEQAGYNSRIFNIKFKDTHTAANGKTGKLFIFEEVGMFNNLEAAYNSSEPCWKEGASWFGMPFLIGTGGDMEKGSISAQKMFFDPDTYNIRAFKGDEGESKIAYFTPGTKVLNDHKDMAEDGITLVTNMETATEALVNIRNKKKAGRDQAAYFQELQYYPFTADEAFIQSTGNIFPQALLQDRYNYLMKNKAAREVGVRGDLEFKEGGKVKFVPNDSLREADYPYNPKNQEGCVIIYEAPEKDAPEYLYIGGTDPYRQDESDSTDSLGATTIYKRFWTPTKTYDWPVATYYGRPETSQEYYENVRMLCIYYNARILYENEVRGMKEYFEQKKSLRYLARQPEIIKDIIKDSHVNRGYGIHMPDKIKSYGELKIREWLMYEYDEGKFNTDKIFSINLLKELINYNRTGNFDRVISLMLVILYNEELHRVVLKDTAKIEHKSMFESRFKKDGFGGDQSFTKLLS